MASLKKVRTGIVRTVLLDILVAAAFLASGLIRQSSYSPSILQDSHNARLFVKRERPVGQTFMLRKERSNIGKIGLHIDCREWGEDEKLTLNVWDSPLKKRLLRSRDLNNPRRPWVYAHFSPPLKVDQTQSLYLELIHNGGGDNRVGRIASSRNNLYPHGELYKAGYARKEEDLTFRIYSKEARPNYLGIATLLTLFAFMHLKGRGRKLPGRAGEAAFAKTFLLLTTLFILFFVEPSGSVAGRIHSGDDNSYYGYVASLVNDFDLDFSNNNLRGLMKHPETGKTVSHHPIGTSLLLIPFYLAGKATLHTSEWMTHSAYNPWHPLFSVLMSGGMVLYLFLGGFLLFKAVSSLFESRLSFLAAAVVIWASILPIYAFRRPIFSHVPEFFLISLLLYLITRLHIQLKSGAAQRISHKEALTLGLVGGGILITRWNDVHVLLFAAYFLLAAGSAELKNRWKNKLAPLAIFSASTAAVFFLTQCQAWNYFTGSYFKWPKYNPAQIAGSFFNTPVLVHLKNLLHIFIGLDWGLLYTMLPMAVGLAALLLLNPLKISRSGVPDRIVSMIVLSLPFLIVLMWRRQASYYGYRYLVSLLPFSCIGLAGFFKSVANRLKSMKLLFICATSLILFNLLTMIPFEHSPGTKLAMGKSVLGGVGYVNNAYVLNSIRFYFSSSLKEIIQIFSYGFGAVYFSGLEKNIVSLYIPLVMLLIMTSHILLTRKNKEELPSKPRRKSTSSPRAA